MRILLVLALILEIIFADSVQSSNAELERLARQILENSRKNFHCGWADHNIGPLDPLLIPKMTVSQRANGVNVVSNLSNVRFLGLRRFIIESISFNPGRTINYVFFVDHTSMTGGHSTRGSMVGIPVVNGQGRMFSEMFNSRYRGTVRWSTRPGTNHIFMVSQYTNVAIQRMTMQMSGFGALNNTVNRQIQEQIPYMITSKEFQDQMNTMLDDVILPAFDAIAAGQTPNTITAHLRRIANNPRKNC